MYARVRENRVLDPIESTLEEELSGETGLRLGRVLRWKEERAPKSVVEGDSTSGQDGILMMVVDVRRAKKKDDE